MISKLPYIETFLNTIDPEDKLDKEKIISEIVLITLIESVKKAEDLLNPESREEVKNLIKPGSSFKPDKALELFKNDGKSEKLQEIIYSTTYENHKDYILTQFNSLNSEDKKRVLLKFPELKEIL